MKKLLSAAAVLAAALVLSACGLISDNLGAVRDYGGKGAAAAVEAECSLSDSERRKNLEAINAALEARGVAYRALPLDCSGDGLPDEI